MLCRCWTFVEKAGAYKLDAPKLMVLKPRLAPLSYYLCLMMAPLIFAKKGSMPEILHEAKDYYYQQLLERRDLIALVALSKDDLMNLKASMVAGQHSR